MADHMVKISEVPKGQKFQFFIDYYGVRTLGIIFLVLCVAYVVFAASQPKPDARILVASVSAIPEDSMNEIENALNNQNSDFNGDGRKMMAINYNYIDESQRLTNPELFVSLQTKLMTSVGDETQIFHILDESMYEFFLKYNAIGTYADIEGYETGHNKDEFVKIPLSDCPIFDAQKLGEQGKTLYLTIRPRANAYLDKSKNLAGYNKHITLLAEMMGYN